MKAAMTDFQGLLRLLGGYYYYYGASCGPPGAPLGDVLGARGLEGSP